MITWIKIDKDNLPNGEVLAACFGENSIYFDQRLFGTLSISSWGSVYCKHHYFCLFDCTHYVEVK